MIYIFKKRFSQCVIVIMCVIFLIIPVFASVVSDEDVREIATIAFHENLKFGDGDLDVIEVNPIQASLKEGQFRAIVYATFGTFVEDNDNHLREVSQMTAIYEVYAILDRAGNTKQTFCAGVIPPRIVAPEIWDEFGLDETSYDPEMLLKQHIQRKSSPEMYESAVTFMKSDSAFADRVWKQIVGKPIVDATKEEISTGFENVKWQVYQQYLKTANQKISESGQTVTFFELREKPKPSTGRYN